MTMRALAARSGEHRVEDLAADVVEVDVDARSGNARASALDVLASCSRWPRRSRALRRDSAHFSAPPAMPTTRQPLILAICPTTDPDRAGRAGDHHRFARLRLADVEQAEIGGHARHAERAEIDRQRRRLGSTLVTPAAVGDRVLLHAERAGHDRRRRSRDASRRPPRRRRRPASLRRCRPARCRTSRRSSSRAWPGRARCIGCAPGTRHPRARHGLFGQLQIAPLELAHRTRGQTELAVAIGNCDDFLPDPAPEYKQSSRSTRTQSRRRIRKICAISWTRWPSLPVPGRVLAESLRDSVPRSV